MKNAGILITFLVLSTVLGCTYPMADLGLYKLNDSPKKSFADSIVSFEVVSQTSLRTCLECHSGGSHSMRTAESVLAQKKEILDSVYSGQMPPKTSAYPQLTACEKMILETWMEDQSANRSGSLRVNQLSACGNLEAPKPTPKTDFATLPLTFENLKSEILAKKCYSCHTSESHGYEYKLENLDSIIDYELVKAGAPDESSIYNVLIPGRTDSFMPKPSSGRAPLTPEEVDFVKRWIEAGAK
jgi:Planctomycete cytochrome C.